MRYVAVADEASSCQSSCQELRSVCDQTQFADGNVYLSGNCAACVQTQFADENVYLSENCAAYAISRKLLTKRPVASPVTTNCAAYAFRRNLLTETPTYRNSRVLPSQTKCYWFWYNISLLNIDERSVVRIAQYSN